MDRLLIKKSSSSMRDEETEEDRKILEEQLKFMRELEEKKIQPAAKVIKLDEKKETDEPSTSRIEKVEDDDTQNQILNVFEDIPKNAIIGPIVVRHKNATNCKSLKRAFDSNGFPIVKRRDMTMKYNNSTSIFAQEMKLNCRLNEPGNNKPSSSPYQRTVIVMNKEDNSKTDKNLHNYTPFVHKSKILSETVKKEIHEQNLNLLKSTPESEILEEKERLLSCMDPALLAYLTRKRKEPESTNLSISQQDDAGQDFDLENFETTAEILEAPGSDKWINFNVIQTHKLAWMKYVETPKIDKEKAFEARFDFEGWLLPFEDAEMNEENRILYHHGEEPERPGYSLKELFTLARSAVLQQKIIALNSIANILFLNSNGVYQDILELPIEQLFFLIRFCMDDNSPGIVKSSVKAMKYLICGYCDEICLDCQLGFGFDHMMPILPVDHEDKDDKMENDQQLAEKNLIRCLVRTRIYSRIRYIINTLRPHPETIKNCLEILIRLSRDSNFVVSEMFDCEELISSIIRNFIPQSYSCGNQESGYGWPMLHALKLVRVLSTRNINLAHKFITEYNIVECISRYLQDETFGENVRGMKLQIECFNLWRIFLEHGLTLEHSSTLESILLKHLDYHIKNTDISENTTYAREGHCSAVLIMLGKFVSLKPSFVSSFQDFYLMALKKWSYQFQRISVFECGKSQIISSLILLSSKVNGYSKLTRTIQGCIGDILKSSKFSKTIENIEDCSMLLNNYELLPFSANLKTLQTSLWYSSDHVIPIMQISSCFPFMTSLSQFVSDCNSILLKLSFLEDTHVKAYIKAIVGTKSFFLTNHWFTRIESQLILNILKIAIDVSKEIDTSIFYSLAVKSLCIFNDDQKKQMIHVMEKIIFCPEFFPTEALIGNLSLNEHDVLDISRNKLDEIKQVYFKILGLSKPFDASTSFCLDIGVGNIIPADWVYTPILLLYSNQQDKTNVLTKDQQTFIVKNCLRWVFIYETFFPDIETTLSPADKFCRLTCVFLCSDELFLNKEIYHLLEKCLKNLLTKYGNKLDFDKPIKGLKNFQDFYNQMLEQYQGVSYGDVLFSNFILVPISQAHNVQWRKTLWSEHIGAAQILHIPEEKLMISMQDFLYPLEENVSLLRCYKTAVARNIIKPYSILYSIAKYHIYENEKIMEVKRENRLSNFY